MVSTVRAAVDPGRFLLGAALACGVLAVLTGAAAVLDYPLLPAAAAVPPGALVDPATRAVHGAAGSLLVVAFALAWVWACLRADDAPQRSRVALASSLAFVATLVAFWTGRVLTGDQHGWESWSHLAAAVDTLRGAEATPPDPQSVPLRTLLVVHVLAALAVAAAFLVPARSWRPRFEALARLGRDARFLTGALGATLATVVLAVLARPLGPAPIVDLAVSRPDWPFLWVAGCERLFGAWGPVFGGMAFVGVVFGAASNARRRPRVVLLSLLAASTAILSAAGAW